MRIWSIAALVLAALLPGAPAGAQDWCYRDFGATARPHCSYPSARACLSFARIAGGVCERARLQAAPQARDPRRSRQRG